MNYKIFNVDVKFLDEQTIEHFISTEDIDRDGDIMKVDGCNTDNFLKNPRVLWVHGFDFNRGRLPIGKCLSVTKIIGKGISAVTQFFDDEFSQTIKRMYKEGFLRAWSVGFMGKRTQDNDHYYFNNWELLEYSAVPVPANPYALAMAKEKGLITDEQVKVWQDEIDENGQVKFMEFTKLQTELKESKDEVIALKDQIVNMQEDYKRMQQTLNDMTHQRNLLDKELREFKKSLNTEGNGKDEFLITEENKTNEIPVITLAQVLKGHKE